MTARSELRLGIGNILKQMRENRILATLEISATKRGEQRWNIYGSNDQKYEEALGLPNGYLKNVVDSIKAQGQTPFVLDVGAETSLLRSLNVPGIAVCLADTRSEDVKREDLASNRYLVNGDVLNLKSWKKIRKVMETMGVQNGFPLIISVAEGGLRQITENHSIHFRLLQEMWNLLNPDGGTLIIKTHISTGKPFYSGDYLLLLLSEGIEYIKHLNNIGVDASYVTTNGVIKFIRHPHAPVKLPRPQLINK